MLSFHCEIYIVKFSLCIIYTVRLSLLSLILLLIVVVNVYCSLSGSYFFSMLLFVTHVLQCNRISIGRSKAPVDFVRLVFACGRIHSQRVLKISLRSAQPMLLVKKKSLKAPEDFARLLFAGIGIPS